MNRQVQGVLKRDTPGKKMIKGKFRTQKKQKDPHFDLNTTTGAWRLYHPRDLNSSFYSSFSKKKKKALSINFKVERRKGTPDSSFIIASTGSKDFLTRKLRSYLILLPALAKVITFLTRVTGHGSRYDMI